MSRNAKDLDMLVRGDAERMGDPYGEDLEILEKLAKKYGRSVGQIRDILDEVVDEDGY
jgi:hypothetical protein